VNRSDTLDKMNLYDLLGLYGRMGAVMKRLEATQILIDSAKTRDDLVNAFAAASCVFAEAAAFVNDCPDDDVATWLREVMQEAASATAESN
jgi:hypothetical protein